MQNGRREKWTDGRATLGGFPIPKSCVFWLCISSDTKDLTTHMHLQGASALLHGHRHGLSVPAGAPTKRHPVNAVANNHTRRPDQGVQGQSHGLLLCLPISRGHRACQPEQARLHRAHPAASLPSTQASTTS